MVKPASSVVRAFTVAAQRAVDRIVLHAVHRRRQARRGLGPADEEVQLHVHEPGQERDVAEVDLGRAGRRPRRGSTATMRLPSITIAAGDRTSPASTSTQRSARRTVVSVTATGSTMQSNVADAGVGDAAAGASTSTGNDTWIIE